MSAITNLIFKGAKHKVTSKYGQRGAMKATNGKTIAAHFHKGTDYASSTSTKKLPQYAIEEGYVFAAQKSAKDGANYVWVIYPRIKMAMLHYHLDSYSCKAGQKVVKGTKLGITGATGNVTGVHLHLGIRDLSKCTTAQINKMTWAILNDCPYVDPEKVSYKEKSAEKPKPVEQPKPAQTTKTTYKVVKGDTLSKIAKKYGTTVNDIVAANPAIKNPNLISVGQAIVIPNAKNVQKPVETVKKPVTPAKKSAVKGTALVLKDEPVFYSASVKNYAYKRTGTFYVYDGQVVNGRIRITNTKNHVGKLPLNKYVTGWINL